MRELTIDAMNKIAAGSGSAERRNSREGLLIALMGLPGCGKSTTAKALSQLVPNSRLFPEPEEEQWPPAVLKRHRFGYFTAITWFRSMRVPLLYMAHQQRSLGGIGIVDSYYDKLIADYIDHPEMKWLIPPSDDYFPVLRELALLDRQLLPNADCVVFLRVTQDQWRHFLSTRQRDMDSEASFLEGFATQETLLIAAQSFTKRSGAHLLLYDQQIGSAESTAEAVKNNLEADGIPVR